MNKVYSDYEHKYVKTTLVYAAADDGVVTYDKEGTQKVSPADLELLYLYGMTVVHNDMHLTPVAFKMDAGKGKITCLYDNADTVTALNFTSDEPAAK